MPTTLFVGENAFIESIPKLISSLQGQRILFFTGSRGLAAIPDFKGRAAFTEEVFIVKGEPTSAMLDRALKVSEQFQPDVIVSIGGGSVIDLAKAVSYLTDDDKELFYYFDHPNVKKKAVPHISVPTTCGTGAEVTANAVIRIEDKKQSLRSHSLRPYAAIIDPILTKHLPLEVLVYSSLDSLTQLMEAFVSNRANPITDGICREGLHLFRKGFQQDRLLFLSTEERLSLQLAALYSGIALSNSRLGIVHGVASILGGRTSMAHGEICARFVRPFTEANIHKAHLEDQETLHKYQEIARILGDVQALTADDLPAILKQYECVLESLTLSSLSFLTEEGEAIAIDSLQASSTQGNPFYYLKEELIDIFETIQ
ncbi:iron-containing alcohol dehydrogenase [Bacillus sp. B15-48]|uniref:iron-containing alcohol dehydrogenase n=1 Tax=Bacillus sp. B15-48 TaxID=1548601 RepID=UPI00193FC282|nr:iron-containing alcohol dehydrogenase [Bacillus sp. B15-48]MBM4761104.1 iron-containing alcohol dehydrogenase [Bacillus sp. B15-48]